MGLGIRHAVEHSWHKRFFIIIIIIQDLYSAMKSKDTEAQRLQAMFFFIFVTFFYLFNVLKKYFLHLWRDDVLGSTGATGREGLQGPRGPTGLLGLQGYTGQPGGFGRQGYTGATGRRGVAGMSITATSLSYLPNSCLNLQIF